MKKFKNLFCLLIIASMAFAGCSLSGGDDDDSTPPPSLPQISDDPQSGSMTAATAGKIFD
jgi:hypothetical protein